MRPYGIYYAVEGCTCALCRSRGYRKGSAYDSSLKVCKKRSRQQARRDILEQQK